MSETALLPTRPSADARTALLEVVNGAWPQIAVIFARTAITTTDTAGKWMGGRKKNEKW
jgi:hypothetical protein